MEAMGHATRQQHNLNSCGAVALLCAAIETGHTLFPPIGEIKTSKVLGLDDDSENALYYISSGAFAKGHSLTGIRGEGESMPSGIVVAAQHIKFSNARIYLRTTLTAAALKAMKPEEVQKCQSIAGAKVIEGKPPELAAGEHKLVVVTGGSVAARIGMAAVNFGLTGNLHYILHRPDGSYMDPGSGTDSHSLPSEYARTGISIIIGS